MLTKAVPILASLNEEETVKFYTEKLGFTFHSSWDGYLIFSRDGIFIHHWPCTDPEIPKATGCYINVTEVDKLYAELEPKGVVHPNGALKDMEWGMRQFSILDNAGNIIHFGEDISGENDE
jgi:catechol 2,3-dioxygenase-like lactoylglutathione lyase family enzyme